MTLDEIKAAVEAGKTVHWSNEGYTVIKDSLGQWLIVHKDMTIGLTWRDGVTMNGEPEEFFIAEEEFWQKAEAGELTEEDWANHLRHMSRQIRRGES
jgi:hypothetical protein